MPKRVLMGDLVTRCKQRCDKVNDSHIQTAEWKSMISTQYGDLYNEVAKTGLRYFETRFTITPTGAASYDEPTAHLSTVGIDRIYSDGRRAELVELMAPERNRFAGLTGDSVAFEHIDDQIYLWPVPPSGATYYELLYVPQPPDLSAWADDQYIDVVTADGEAFMIWGVAVQAKEKEEADTRKATQERDEARVRVVEWATLKAFHQPRRKMVLEDMALGYDPAEHWWHG